MSIAPKADTAPNSVYAKPSQLISPKTSQNTQSQNTDPSQNRSSQPNLNYLLAQFYIQNAISKEDLWLFATPTLICHFSKALLNLFSFQKNGKYYLIILQDPHFIQQKPMEKRKNNIFKIK